jgi:hypothetical protein
MCTVAVHIVKICTKALNSCAYHLKLAAGSRRREARLARAGLPLAISRAYRITDFERG